MPGSPKVEDERILQAIALAPDPIVTAKELTQVLDYSVDGVRNRLNDLEKKGYVESRDVGARAEIWWLTDLGRENLR